MTSFHRILGPIKKVLKTVTGVQTLAALVAALGAGQELELVSATVYVTTAEAGKFLYIFEEDEAIPLVKQTLATAGTYHLFFGEQGIPVTDNKALQWQSDATTAVMVLVVTYRHNPGGF